MTAFSTDLLGPPSRCLLAQVGEPDLLIRTSGELRLSNFLLWESAYTVRARLCASCETFTKLK